MTIDLRVRKLQMRYQPPNRSGQTQKYPYSCLPFVPVQNYGRTNTRRFLSPSAALPHLLASRSNACALGNDATASVQHKSGRTRFYSADQLEKLKKIKHLIDRGQTVSSVINLSESQLHQRLTDQNALTLNTSPPTKEASSPKLDWSVPICCSWNNSRRETDTSTSLHAGQT